MVKAVDLSSGEVIAIKIVESCHFGSSHSLQQEADILQSMPAHPNVIRFKFLKTFKKYILMGLEYCKDKTLLELIKQRTSRKPLPEETVS